MSNKETIHLPTATLEIEFSGGESTHDEFHESRHRLKDTLLKNLIADGVAFQEKALHEPKDDLWTRMESIIDLWAVKIGYHSVKAKDKQSKKVRWILTSGEQITILLLPAP